MSGGKPEDAKKISRRNLLIGLVIGIGAAAVVAAIADASVLFSKSGKSSTTTPTTTQTTAPTTTQTTSQSTSQTTTPSTTQTTSQSTSQATTSSTAGFPSTQVATVSQLVVGQPVLFNYPLSDEPSFLVKLGTKATGGVGPDGDIVAFSAICQHVGQKVIFQAANSPPSCNPSYTPQGPVGFCCTHYSVYDLVNGGNVINGPAPLPIPQVQLVVDSSGNISAVGMGPPTIYGHNTGSNDVSADLQG
jgi:arsenite oxidase small subunit